MLHGSSALAGADFFFSSQLSIFVTLKLVKKKSADLPCENRQTDVLNCNWIRKPSTDGKYLLGENVRGKRFLQLKAFMCQNNMDHLSLQEKPVLYHYFKTKPN